MLISSSLPCSLARWRFACSEESIRSPRDSCSIMASVYSRNIAMIGDEIVLDSSASCASVISILREDTSLGKGVRVGLVGLSIRVS